MLLKIAKSDSSHADALVQIDNLYVIIRYVYKYFQWYVSLCSARTPKCQYR